MRRRELIRELERVGCLLVRHGARYDIYRNPATGSQQPVPRHDEIDNDLAKQIKKFLGVHLCADALDMLTKRLALCHGLGQSPPCQRI